MADSKRPQRNSRARHRVAKPSNRKPILLAGAGVVVLLLIGVMIYRQVAPQTPAADTAAESPSSAVMDMPDDGSEHTTANQAGSESPTPGNNSTTSATDGVNVVADERTEEVAKDTSHDAPQGGVFGTAAMSATKSRTKSSPPASAVASAGVSDGVSGGVSEEDEADDAATVEGSDLTTNTESTPQTPNTSSANNTTAPPSMSAFLRSPLATLGEFFHKPIPARRLDGVTEDDDSYIFDPDAPIVPWHEAKEHVGQSIVVEGRVVGGNNTGSVCFLNFDKNWRGKFYVILFRDVLNSWPLPPEQQFMNKVVHVRGRISTHKGVPQLRVRNPAQISIVDR